MRIYFIGKRYYTNQDALAQSFGRIFQLPLCWNRSGQVVKLSLVDYRNGRRNSVIKDGLSVDSVPLPGLREMSASIRDFQPDIIIASGDCFVGVLGYLFSRYYASRFAFDVYDDYRTFGGYRAFLGWDAFGFICQRADLVMYASTTMAAKHDYGSIAIVAPNGIDESIFASTPMNSARVALNLPTDGSFVGYFGSMTPQHGVDVLIRAVSKLRSRRRDLGLLLCGKRQASTPVRADGVVYRGMVAHASIPLYLNACNVLALPYLRGPFLDMAASCKIAEYLFCHRPIVATSSPNFVQNFPRQAKELGTLVVPPGDSDALADAIERQLDHPLILEPPLDMTWKAIAERLFAQFEAIVDRE